MAQPATLPYAPSPALPFTNYSPSPSPTPTPSNQTTPSSSPPVLTGSQIPSATATTTSSSSSSSTTTNGHPQNGTAASMAHLGVNMLMENRFKECTEMFAKSSDHDNKIALLHCYMSFIQAASSHGESDLKSTLNLVWAIEKRAAEQAAKKSHHGAHHSIEGKLIQADLHFLGALVQLISQKYLKAALNLRRSWNFYIAAEKDLQNYHGHDRDGYVGWCQFGNGFFNLVMSFLPPTVLKVASWTGYAGDRDVGLQLLHKSQQSSSFMAPFSCLLLLTYYVSIASYTGEPEDTYLEVSEALFKWAEERYPEGVLFLLMKSRSWRCKRDLHQAITTAKQAIHNCKELPSVAVLFHFNTGFCSFFLLDWQQSAYYFDQLIHMQPSGNYTPPPNSGLKKHSDAELALIEEDKKTGLYDVRMPPAKASALTFYACMVGINYMLLSMPHKARYYFGLVDGLMDKKSSKPIDLYAKRKSTEFLSRTTGDHPEDALLDACELLLIWNGASQMTESALKRVIEMLDAAEKKALPHWKMEQKSVVFLYRAEMLKGLGEFQAALKQINGFLAYAPQLQNSAKAKVDGSLAFGLYVSAYLLLKENNVPLAAEQLKRAQAITGYDQYNQLQVRMHAQGQLIKKRKLELGLK